MLRRTLAAFQDSLLAMGCSMLGALVGWLAFLAIGVVTGETPKRGDFAAIKPVMLVGLTAGVILGPMVRILVGPVQRQWLWAIGFLVLGAVIGPAALIAVIAWVMSSTGGW